MANKNIVKNDKYKLCRKEGHPYLKESKQCPKCQATAQSTRYKTIVELEKIRCAKRYKADPKGAITKSQEWQRSNPDRVRGNNLRKFWPDATWRAALSNYNRLLADQNGVCAICEKPERSKAPNGNKFKYLDVDHNHKTGKVRGLLCNPCNRAEGLLGGDPKIARKLASYLEKDGEYNV